MQCHRLAVVEPENQWWRELNLGSPEAIIKLFAQNSRCFTIVYFSRAPLPGRALFVSRSADQPISR